MVAMLSLAVIRIFGPGVAINRMGEPVEFARATAVRLDIAVINTQLRLYKSMNGFYPTTEQGLQALVTLPVTEPRPTRWFQFLREKPKDPWGNDYVYRSPGKIHPDTYDLFSPGPDHIADTVDDDWGE